MESKIQQIQIRFRNEINTNYVASKFLFSSQSRIIPTLILNKTIRRTLYYRVQALMNDQ